MVIYSEMTDQEIKEYREKCMKEAKKREEEWKKNHSKDYRNNYTPFDRIHDETPISGR